MDCEESEEDFYSYRLKNHKPLKFGTSGLRGLDSELTDMQVYISVKGFLKYLISQVQNQGEREKIEKIALAGDFRPSTPRILIAVAAAIIDSGKSIDYCGKVPTPTVSLWGFKNKIPSIMVTASHNPYGQNGVKFNKTDGEILKKDEKGILEEISAVREEEYKKSPEESFFQKNGLFKNYSVMSEKQKVLYDLAFLSVTDHRINHKAKEFYINRYKHAFGKILKDEKIVFYQQTCVGRDIIPEIFRELGAQVICEERVDETKEFVAIDTEDMKEGILDKMANLAHKNNMFVTITVDGDSDRPAVLLVRKNKDGKHHYKNDKLQHYYIKGDKLNVLAALLFKPDFFSAPISFNSKAANILRKNGIEVKLTKVGSPYVIKAMLDRLEKEKKKHEESGINMEEKELLEKIKLYACEVNGGGLLGSHGNLPEHIFEGVFERGHGKLVPLPTRDAVFPILCALILAKKKGLDFEGLVKEVFSGEFESHSHAGLVENLPGVSVTKGCELYSPEIGKKIIESFSVGNPEVAEVRFQEELYFLNHNEEELFVEEIIKNRANEINEVLVKYIKDILDLGDVTIDKINFLDGIRVYLSCGEIVHFRPSGNSAQFRIYVEADSLERANQMVQRATRESDGVLVKLINDFIN